MVTSKAKSVDEYLAQCDASLRPALEQFRRLVKKAVPRCVESMTYGMPTYALASPFAAFNAQKNYLSFYVLATDAVTERKGDLKGLDCGQSCLRGRKIESFPLQVLAELTTESARRCGSTAPATGAKKRAVKKTAPKTAPAKSASRATKTTAKPASKKK